MPGVVIAVIAPTPLLFGMARMWEALVHRTNWRVKVDRSCVGAYAWLRSRLPDLSIADPENLDS